jgi:hypothetical protein
MEKSTIKGKSTMQSALDRIAIALELQYDPDSSLTTEEAGRFLRVSSATILRYQRAGLPFYKAKDHGMTFRRRDLIDWREQFRTINRQPLKLVEKDNG